MNLSDRAKAAIGAFVAQLTSKYDYAQLYACTVVSQNGDYSLELKPDSSMLPGLSKVPIWSLPGTTVVVGSGARCRVGFDNGDPSKPFAALFEPSSLVALQFAGAQPIARQGDTVSTPLPAGFTFTITALGLVCAVGPVTGVAVCTVVAAPLTLGGTIISGSAKALA